jgi:type I restriction enzyme M protein
MFIKEEVKSKINSIWDKFWSGGIANPLNAIEQITALIFLKMLSNKDNQKLKQLENLHNSLMQKAFKGEIK